MTRSRWMLAKGVSSKPHQRFPSERNYTLMCQYGLFPEMRFRKVELRVLQSNQNKLELVLNVMSIPPISALSHEKGGGV